MEINKNYKTLRFEDIVNVLKSREFNVADITETALQIGDSNYEFEFNGPEKVNISLSVMFKDEGENLLVHKLTITNQKGILYRDTFDEGIGYQCRLFGYRLTLENLNKLFDHIYNPHEQSNLAVDNYRNKLNLFHQSIEPYLKSFGLYPNYGHIYSHVSTRFDMCPEVEYRHPNLVMSYVFTYDVILDKLIFHNPCKDFEGDEILELDLEPEKCVVEGMTIEEFKIIFEKAIEPVKHLLKC